MFKLAPVETIRMKVNIQIPGDDNKTKTKSDFSVIFKRRNVEERKEILDVINDEDQTLVDDDVLAKDIISIEGVVDANDEAVVYAPELLDQLLNMDYVRKPLMEAWIQVNMGQEFYKAYKAKNL